MKYAGDGKTTELSSFPTDGTESKGDPVGNNAAMEQSGSSDDEADRDKDIGRNGLSEEQPFSVLVHPQVSFLCDLHGHLSTAEVIGLLAGRWDPDGRHLWVQAPFPCISVARDDHGSTDVELDPVAELEVREVIQGLGMQVVGWYHSHPRFCPNPSVTDIRNQQQYQRLMRDELSGKEPFVGLIVSTFDEERESIVSHHQWFNVCTYTGETSRRKVYPQNFHSQLLVDSLTDSPFYIIHRVILVLYLCSLRLML
jgi:proteasome lid subunit RPN8/RPN11